MGKIAYKLVWKILLLFMVNSIRGAIVHWLIHEVRATLLRHSPHADREQIEIGLLSIRDNAWWLRPSRQAKALSGILHAVISGLPELIVLFCAARDSVNPENTTFHKETLHTLLRDAAWSSPMFCFVINSVAHTLAAYAGGLYRQRHGPQHVDAADREDADSFFTV